MDNAGLTTDFCVPVFFINPRFIDITDYKEEALVAIRVCEAAVAVVGDNIEGAQLQNKLWRLYPKNTEARVKLLSCGITVHGHPIQLLDLNPFKVGENDRDAQKSLMRISIKGLPLSVCNSVIRNFLEEKNVDMKSEIKYDYHRHPQTNRLTAFKSGGRFVYAKKLEAALPRNVTFGQFKAQIFHRDQLKRKCVVCDNLGHLPGSQDCTHYLVTPNITTIRSHTNVLSNMHDTKVTVDDTTFTSLEHAYLHRKALQHKREDIAQEILNAEHAGIARAKARPLPEDETEGCYDMDFMETLVKNKLASSTSFRNALRETGQGIIAVCGGLSNGFWSTSLNEIGTKNTDPTRWPGQNKLGELLMKVRDEQFWPTSLSSAGANTQEHASTSAVSQEPSSALLEGQFSHLSSSEPHASQHNQQTSPPLSQRPSRPGNRSPPADRPARSASPSRHRYPRPGSGRDLKQSTLGFGNNSRDRSSSLKRPRNSPPTQVRNSSKQRRKTASSD